MDFGLSEEHLMVQRMVRDFAAKEVAPTIQEQDRLGGMAPHVIPRYHHPGKIRRSRDGLYFPRTDL